MPEENFELSQGSKSESQAEKSTKKPILEIQISENEKIAFFDLDSFNPLVIPSKKLNKIPPSIELYLLRKEKLAGTNEGASTYQETIKEKNWEGKLFYFISLYLEKHGADTIKELKIKHLDALAPKQAVELATRIVIDLSKYNKYQDEHTTKIEKTKADQSTALELLQEGLVRRHDPHWKGNGVCRNFASAVKAVFEALKANQTPLSQLRDTYCLYEGGDESFAPKREKKHVFEIRKTSHAWNSFVTIFQENEAHTTIVDTTWAKRNLDTKQIEGIDYTLTRMEPIVYEIGEKLQKSSQGKEQLKHILSYYMLKINTPSRTGGLANEEEKQFYITRALKLMLHQGATEELPKLLVETISKEYQKLAGDANIEEIEILYRLSQNNPNLYFDTILKAYLKNKELSDYHVNSLIFKDNNLQRKTYNELKSHKNFDALIKQSPSFRVRMREILPQLFTPFSPATQQEDALELKYLITHSQLLNPYKYILLDTTLSEEKIREFFEKAKQQLRSINPQKYDGTTIARLDDYHLVKLYDKLTNALKD